MIGTTPMTLAPRQAQSQGPSRGQVETQIATGAGSGVARDRLVRKSQRRTAKRLVHSEASRRAIQAALAIQVAGVKLT